MKKITRNLMVVCFMAGFLYMTSCGDDVTPLAPNEELLEIDTTDVRIGKVTFTDGEEGDSTGGPRTQD